MKVFSCFHNADAHSRYRRPAAAALLCAAVFVMSGAGAFAAQETTDIPAYYNAGALGKKPAVRSQGSRSTCWALTAVSALEAGLLPEKNMMFSAEHMLSCSGFTGREEQGGDYRMIMAYLSGWRGPVLEEQMPYGETDIAGGADLQAAVHVQEIRMLEDAAIEEVKQLIIQYGPVQTSLYMDRKTCDSAHQWYCPETCAYYYTEEAEPTHDVLILGWDDAFPAESFLIPPEGDGAWICQNTWGEDFGEDGIFYVSYSDTAAARSALVCSVVEDPDNYDRIYQTDLCGWQGRQGYNAETCYFANIFRTGSGGGNEPDELLRAVGFYNTGDYSEYEIWAVPDYQSVVSFDDRIFCGRGELEGMGYFTVSLDEPVLLQGRNRFAVIVKIRTEGAVRPVAVETDKDDFTGNVSLEDKWGYLSKTGELWEHTEEKFGTNICLHAYTAYITESGFE